VVRVRDEGPGIPPEYGERISRAFTVWKTAWTAFPQGQGWDWRSARVSLAPMEGRSG